MFFMKTWKRNKLMNSIIKIFGPVYDVRKNFKLDSRNTLPLFFPELNIAICFNSLDEKKKKAFETLGVKPVQVVDLNDVDKLTTNILQIIKLK